MGLTPPAIRRSLSSSRANCAAVTRVRNTACRWRYVGTRNGKKWKKIPSSGRLTFSRQHTTLAASINRKNDETIGRRSDRCSSRRRYWTVLLPKRARSLHRCCCPCCFVGRQTRLRATVLLNCLTLDQRALLFESGGNYRLSCLSRKGWAPNWRKEDPRETVPNGRDSSLTGKRSEVPGERAADGERITDRKKQ